MMDEAILRGVVETITLYAATGLAAAGGEVMGAKRERLAPSINQDRGLLFYDKRTLFEVTP